LNDIDCTTDLRSNKTHNTQSKF